ncbi:MAG: amidohydrolase family protein [Actinomycetota bacterium]
MRAIRAELVWEQGAFERDRCVIVDGARIADVVRPRRVRRGIEVEDWGHVALVPGTVNAHGHAFQSLFRGLGDDRSFESWRDDVLYPLAESLGGDDIYAGAVFAFTEALLAGITTTVDFFYMHDGGNSNAERVVQAAHDVGIRLVLARAFYDPDAPTKAPRRFRENVDDAVSRCRDLAAALAGDPLIAVQPAPHSLHAAAPETIGAALDLARELDTPCHLHVAEAAYEVELIRERYGTTPVRLLQREGLLDERLIAVHAVWVDDEELDMLAEARCRVVHCPGANAFLGDGVARVTEMLERGLQVGLGPDGGCANNRQSVFDEMRTASLFAKARLLDGGALDAPTVFTMGTKTGADLLGLDTGAIQAGLYADLVALDLDDPSLHPLATVERNIVHSMQSTAIARVMAGGEVVVDGGLPTRLELAEVLALVEATTSGWTRP